MAGKEFEEVYSLLSQDAKYSAVLRELEKAVFDYFSALHLPRTPTIYDVLLLSLRQKDVIATFNWDPFLIQAWQRSAKLTDKLPTLLFLHGNVAHGYCDRDNYQGLRGQLCTKCGGALQPDKLLFPVATKNYSSDPAIRKAWEVTREALKNALMVTTFGYSAPASDKDALSIMSEAWGKPANRQFEVFEMIDIKSRDELYASWNHSYSAVTIGWQQLTWNLLWRFILVAQLKPSRINTLMQSSLKAIGCPQRKLLRNFITGLGNYSRRSNAKKFESLVCARPQMGESVCESVSPHICASPTHTGR